MSVRASVAAVLVLVAAAGVAAAQPPPAVPVQPAAPPAPAPPAAPVFEVQVVTAPAVHAIVLPMKGSYMQHPDAFGRLMGAVSTRGLAPAGPIFARYFSDPSTPEADLVWEVGVPVAAGTTAEAPFEAKDIPATLVALHTHQGAMEELGAAWGSMIQWVMANGYQPLGPPTQVFKGDMTAGMPQVEMQMPVQK
jgi:effector-binding domain-containing protein